MSNLYEIITLFDSYVLYKFINLVRINMKIPDCAGRKCTDRRISQVFFTALAESLELIYVWSFGGADTENLMLYMNEIGKEDPSGFDDIHNFNIHYTASNNNVETTTFN